MSTVTQPQRAVLSALNLGDRLSHRHTPGGETLGWTVIDGHGLAVFKPDPRTARAVVRKGWVEKIEGQSDEYRTRYRISGAGREEVTVTDDTTGIADRLNEERCVECGRELEKAGPYGPLYCPDCDPHLAPDTGDGEVA